MPSRQTAAGCLGSAKRSFFIGISFASFLVFAAAPHASALVGSNSGSSIFNGVYINNLVGANTFYSMGFGGSQAIVANIEAGSIWNGHETLGNVATFFSDPSIIGTQLGQTDWHATFVGQVIAGNGIYTYQDGIAPGATLWSGSIATEWIPSPGSDYSGSFQQTDASLAYAYDLAIHTGIPDGNNVIRQADVINSSWGFIDPSGSAPETIFIDSLLRENRVVGVFAAGNSGPAANTVGGPASGFNGITVAALTGDTTSPAYSQVADFSSRGASDFYNPETATTTSGIRPVIDIAAPGDNLTLAFYGGVTGGHTDGTDPTGGNGTFYVPNMSGTSFAAPIVAGAAALLTDAGKTFGVTEMTDPLVIKAALMTSATRIPGWDNAQVVDSGVVTTTQALDLASGAGALNLDSAYRVYVGDPTIVGNVRVGGVNTQLGLTGNGGGTVLNRGWDLGEVADGTPTLYSLTEEITAGSEFTATLTWFAGRYGSLLSTAEDRDLANLRLELLREDPLGDIVVARSNAPVSTVEFLRLTVPETGIYMIRIAWDGFNFNLDSNPSTPITSYGLAWNVNAVPEPSVIFLLALSVALIIAHKIRRAPKTLIPAAGKTAVLRSDRQSL